MDSKKAALYIRVSTIDQAREGYSLAAQEKLLTEYCQQRGYEIFGTYRDEGISGKDLAHRPGVTQLLNDAKQDLFGAVIVWKITRLSRSLADLCSVCALFHAHNIILASYSEAFDASTPSGRMMLNLLGVIAQWEREVISENVKMGMEERAATGKCTCPYVLGYDKVGDNLVLNEKEAEVVRFVYTSYIACRNMAYVSNLCDLNDYRGKMGAHIKPESVHKILTRFVYCGYNSYNRTPIRGKHDAIISTEMYNSAQNILMENTGGRKRKRPLVWL
jgi:site-specific DNA recombinase